MAGRPTLKLLSLSLATLAACSGSHQPGAGPGGDRPPGGRVPLPAGVSGREPLTGLAVSTPPARALDRTPAGPFGLSLVATEDGAPADIRLYEQSETCGECHPRQWSELKGSLHSVSHRDTLYRRTAELARAEAGPAVYAYCSGCHTPQGVASRLVPDTPEEQLPEAVKAGILCDTCHTIAQLTGEQGPWGEPGNASLVLAPHAERKFGPPSGVDADADHEVQARPFFTRSEFCASCHTVIHPLNGVRIEHTYAEWKKSVYADKGIQCQDCHMRTVAQARRVAATLQPVALRGKSTAEGKDRPIAYHLFAGGNASADLLGGGAGHARMAAERLQSAARLEILAPARASAGAVLRFAVQVTNIGAGHNLPTSLTELREMWVDLQIKAAGGEVLFRSGALDAQGEIDPGAMRFGARAGDKDGKLTYKPWEVTHFLWKRLIAPKASAKDAFSVRLPAGAAGPLTIEARLLYRSAPPKVLAMLYGETPIALRTVQMAAATHSLALR